MKGEPVQYPRGVRTARPTGRRPSERSWPESSVAVTITDLSPDSITETPDPGSLFDQLDHLPRPQLGKGSRPLPAASGTGDAERCLRCFGRTFTDECIYAALMDVSPSWKTR